MLKKRVGFWVSPNKDKRLKMEQFSKTYISEDLEFVKIDLDLNLEIQGPFDCVVHKFLDLIVSSNETNENHKKWKKIEKYCKQHGKIMMLDPLETIPVMIDRYKQNILTHRVVQHPKIKQYVYAPNFCRFDSNDVEKCMKEVVKHGLEFPILCKPEVAHGEIAHNMSLVFHKQGFRDIEAPCVGQTFINHNAKLFKIFIVGTHTYIFERPSVKNLKSGNYPTMFFNTCDVSQEKSHHKLTEHDQSMSCSTEAKIDEEKFKEIASIYTKESQLNLYGIDLIFCCVQRKFVIIDVNCFPGYEKMPEFFQCLTQLIRHRLNLPPSDINGICSHYDINNNNNNSSK